MLFNELRNTAASALAERIAEERQPRFPNVGQGQRAVARHKSGARPSDCKALKPNDLKSKRVPPRRWVDERHLRAGSPGSGPVLATVWPIQASDLPFRWLHARQTVVARSDAASRLDLPNPNKTNDMKSISARSWASKLVESFQDDAGHSVLGLTADEVDLLEPPPLAAYKPWVVRPDDSADETAED